MKSVFGKYADVNLTTGEISEFNIPNDLYEKHLGGRGIAVRLLLENLKPQTDPLGEDNILIFGTGPLQGTRVAGAGRHIVATKSPKTQAISDSYAGGYFGEALGSSGYDGLIIRGKGEQPQYISLIDKEPKIHDAEELWGFSTYETEDKLKEKYKGSRVSSIGQAGENLVKFACIINDLGRAAGRPGFGAVMGSKNLKAVVVRGDFEKKLANEKGFNSTRGYFARELNKSAESLGKYGTAGSVSTLNELGILPTKNFKEGEFSSAEEIGGEHMYDTILTRRETCANCPIRCKRQVKARFAKEEVEAAGPEYETLAAFGSLCLNDNLESIVLANHKCNTYGLDTISTGNNIACIIEATEKGLIDTDLSWGDADGIVKTVDKIGRREGIGAEIARGKGYLENEYGIDFAVGMKNLEASMHEPRGKKGFGIDFATSPRGATHLEGLHDEYLMVDKPAPELGINEPMDRLSFNGKPKAVNTWDKLTSFGNSLILCRFTSTIQTGKGYNFDQIRDMTSKATGLEIDLEKMLRIGERNYAILKLASVRAGWTKEKDGLHPRFHKPLQEGVCAGERITKDEMNQQIEYLYELKGFDEFGPTSGKLEELEIGELKEYRPTTD